MNIYILLLGLILMMLLSYILLQGDIMAPSVMMSLGYILSVLSAIYNIDNWDIELSGETCWIICVSIAVFMIAEVSSKYVWDRRNTEFSYKAKYIDIPNKMIILYTIFALAVVFLYYHEVYRISASNGYNGNGNYLTYYRNAASYGILSAEEDINFFVNQLYKIIAVTGYLFLFFVLNNYFAMEGKGGWRKMFIYRIPIYIYVFSSVLTSSRMQFLHIAIYAVTLYSILWHRSNGWNRNVSGKLIKYGFLILFLILALFAALKGVVGRTNTELPFTYITRYAGASIELLDQYLKNPVAKGKYWGEETFYGIYTALRKLGLSDYDKISHLEFRRLGNYLLSSNTYTAVRRYMHDFGIMGMCALEFIEAKFFSFLYYKYVRKNKGVVVGIIYSYLFYVIPLQSINEIFYSNILSIGNLIFIVEIIIAYFCFTKIRFVCKGEKK